MAEPGFRPSLALPELRPVFFLLPRGCGRWVSHGMIMALLCADGGSWPPKRFRECFLVKHLAGLRLAQIVQPAGPFAYPVLQLRRGLVFVV